MPSTSGDGRTTVAVPEWQAGSSFRHQDSVAAYSLADTRGNRITIQAVRVPRGGSPQRGGARTSDVRVGRPCLAADRPAAPADNSVRLRGLPALQLRRLPRLAAPLSGRPPAPPRRRRGLRGGAPKSRRISLDGNGQTGFETFELEGFDLGRRGIGVHDVTWRWQFRRAGGDAEGLGVSRHRVYGLLETPTRPWRQTPYRRTNIELPWTDVLDHAQLGGGRLRPR